MALPGSLERAAHRPGFGLVRHLLVAGFTARPSPGASGSSTRGSSCLLASLSTTPWRRRALAAELRHRKGGRIRPAAHGDGRPSDERPSSGAPCAGAGRAVHRQGLSNRVSSEGHPFDRPLPQQRSRSSSARPSSSASRPSARAATDRRSLAAVTRTAAHRRRDGEALAVHDERAPRIRRIVSRATVSQAKAPRNFGAPRGASAGRAGCEPSCRQAPFPRAPHCPGGSRWRFSARRRRLGHRRRGRRSIYRWRVDWARWMPTPA